MQTPPLQIGPYEFQREIGRGGMGVVYLARDTRLDREVAIKALPADLLADADRLARFQREARTLASLSHANIAAVHGMEEADGAQYLVMEYVDGEDLSQRIRDGGLPVDEALHIAKQIARAVEAAHAGGVIHRDLKPANVKVTVDGDVKVLDFGLAKALDGGVEASALADSPTRVAANSPTMPGVVLGTAGYMSPEQARGKPIDKRSDIWSFGCILYEMLTGKCPFPGDSVPESLGATIHKEPDWNALPPATPPNIQLLLHRCLQKDRSRRLQDIGDARVELDDTLSGSTSIWTRDVQVTSSSSASRWPGLPWLALTTVLLLVAVGLSIMITRLTEPRAPVVRAFVPPPPGVSFVPHGELAGPAVVSPDGRALAFTAMGPSQRRSLWIRPLESTEARELPGTEDATFPFWSGDSRSLGYFTDGFLKRADLDGGTPMTICSAVGRGGTWNRDGDILFAPEFASEIYRVPATGGTPEPITTIDSSRHTSHRWPSFLPDGRHFLYSAIHAESSRAADNAIYFASLDGGAGHEVMRSSLNAQGTDEHLLFVRDGTLMAAPFDAAKGVIEGDPEPLAASVAYNLATWKAAFSCSPRGIIAYNPGGLTKGEGTKITTYDRSGRELDSVSQVTSGGSLRVSPDGGRFGFSTGRAASSMDVWVYDVARRLPRRLTFLPGFESGPVWSPDGNELFFGYGFRSSGDAAEGVYRIAAGGGPPVLVWEGEGFDPTAVSPDGRYLLLSRDADDVWVLPLSPPGEPVALIRTSSVFEDAALFSPDGRWISYIADESGILEAYVVQFVGPSDAAGAPRVGGKWQISNGGALFPKWSRDGSELYYLAPDDMLMAVGLKADQGRLVPGPARPLFEMHIDFGNNFDVTPEGHFVATSAQETSTEPVALILNWTSELER